MLLFVDTVVVFKTLLIAMMAPAHFFANLISLSGELIFDFPVKRLVARRIARPFHPDTDQRHRDRYCDGAMTAFVSGGPWGVP